MSSRSSPRAARLALLAAAAVVGVVHALPTLRGDREEQLEALDRITETVQSELDTISRLAGERAGGGDLQARFAGIGSNGQIADLEAQPANLATLRVRERAAEAAGRR